MSKDTIHSILLCKKSLRREKLLQTKCVEVLFSSVFKAFITKISPHSELTKHGECGPEANG